MDSLIEQVKDQVLTPVSSKSSTSPSTSFYLTLAFISLVTLYLISLSRNKDDASKRRRGTRSVSGGSKSSTRALKGDAAAGVKLAPKRRPSGVLASPAGSQFGGGFNSPARRVSIQGGQQGFSPASLNGRLGANGAGGPPPSLSRPASYSSSAAGGLVSSPARSNSYGQAQPPKQTLYPASSYHPLHRQASQSQLSQSHLPTPPIGRGNKRSLTTDDTDSNASSHTLVEQHKRSKIQSSLDSNIPEPSQKVASTKQKKMDVDVEVTAPPPSSRGVKRSASSEEDDSDHASSDEATGGEHGTKRSRRTEPVHQAQKRRHSYDAEGEEGGRKRSARDTGKRGLERSVTPPERAPRTGDASSEGSVYSDDEDDVDSEGDKESGKRAGTRNADSEYGSSEEGEPEEGVEDKRETGGKYKKKGAKRSRSTLVAEREGSEDDDVMAGQFDELAPSTSASSASTPKKSRRRLPTTSRTTTSKPGLQKRRAPVSGASISKNAEGKAGEEWVDLEGERWRIDEEDGIKRKRCEVREWRKKFRMPKDSKHRDRDEMHEVVVEKWLTEEEYERALKERKLAWQVPADQLNAEAANGEGDMEGAEGGADAESQPKKSTVYTPPTSGNSTPLRSRLSLSSSTLSLRHSLSSSNLSSSLRNSPTLASLGTSTPPLLRQDGRLRLASLGNSVLGSGGNGTSSGGSSPRVWAKSAASRILEDEREMREKRDKRRRASIRLGGEEEVKEVEVPKFEQVKKVEPTKEAAAPAPAPLASAPPSGSAIPSFFGASSSASSAPPASKQPTFDPIPPKPTVDLPKPAATPTPAPGGFSFGGTSTPAPVAAAPAPTAAPAPFSFGTPAAAAPKPAAPVPSTPAPFSFGAPQPAAPTPAAPAPTSAPPAPFTFGAAPPAAAPSTPSAVPFTFGAAAKPAAPAPSASTPSFSFGSSVSAAPSAPQPAAPAFSFGASSAAAAPLAAATPSPFNFGTPAAATSTTATTSTPAFNFGVPAAAPSTPSTAPGFTFGAAPTPAGAAASGTPAFTFGGAPAPSSMGGAAGDFNFSFGAK